MTPKELRSKLLSVTEINEVGYLTVSKNAKLPYIAYYADGTDNEYADNTAIVEYTDYVIELYTKVKDFNLERKIKNILRDNEIGYRITTDTYLESEKAHMTVFEIILEEVL